MQHEKAEHLIHGTYLETPENRDIPRKSGNLRKNQQL